MEDWRSGENVPSVGSRTEILEDVRSLPREHNFSPDNASESIGLAFLIALTSDVFARASASTAIRINSCT